MAPYVPPKTTDRRYLRAKTHNKLRIDRHRRILEVPDHHPEKLGQAIEANE